MNAPHLAPTLLPFLLLLLACQGQVQAAAPAPEEAGNPQRISLNGEWSFAVDYRDAGDQYQWFASAYKDGMWDRVTTPHVWSMDPRYPYYVGTAWYRRGFAVPPELRDRHVRLVFEAVYARSRVWLNGTLIAEHDGGYTPFTIDVSPHLIFDKPNLLVVRVDNRPEAHAPEPQPQLVRPWMEDGGIIRDAYLLVTSRVFVTRQKVEAVPDLAGGTAAVRVRTWIRNALATPVALRLSAACWREQEHLTLPIPAVQVSVPANGTADAEMVFTMPREQVRLWSLDTPVLYRLRTTVAGAGADATATETFGIRRFETSGAELLLNGKPIRLAGANRVANGTDFGQNDPPEKVERDLRLMKEAGLEFMRMHHVPLSRAVLDWADRHGLLLIEECSHATPENLDAEDGRASFRAQFREMIERDWNRPSIVAWSVGNEFASDTPAGVRWVRDMVAHTRSIDASRLVVFASNCAAKKNITAEKEGSSLTDIVCLNTYGATPDDNAANIDRVHERWPGKPLIITEFGLRTDRVGAEADRELWFTEMIRIFRKRPFLSGASIWTFNDYRSRTISTNPDGYRWWGLVDARRSLRGTYDLCRREFSPLVLKEACFVDRAVRVTLAGRTDFPLYPTTAVQVRLAYFDSRGRALGNQAQEVTVAPGQEAPLLFPLPDGATYFRGEMSRGEFLVMAFGPTTWSKIKR